MERGESSVHQSMELDPVYFANNQEIPERSTNEKDLEIEVLDIDQFGIFSETEEKSDEFDENVSSSPVKSIESASPVIKTSKSVKKYLKSRVRLQVRNYKCHDCGFSTQVSRNYLYHLKDVHKENFLIHECNICDYASKHVKNLQRHCNIIHKKNTGYKQGTNKKILSGYSKKRKPKSSRKFQCNLCDFHTTSERVLSVHITYHTELVKEENTGNLDINSEKCLSENIVNTDESDIYSTNEIDHISFKKQKSHKCPICKMDIQYISWLIRHLRNNHRGNIRAEALASAYEMKKRKKRPNNTESSNILSKRTNRNISSKSNQMKLEDFGLSSVSVHSMANGHKDISHENSHTDSNNTIKCNICYYEFKDTVDLQEHMQTHSMSPICDFGLNSTKGKKCDFSEDTNYNTSLIPKVGNHLTILRNIRNGPGLEFSTLKYKCPYCSFSIRSVSRFHVHFIQHMKNIQFRCSDCDYHSSWKWTVVKHIWSKVRHERNHFNAFVLTNNELVDLNSFKLYKKYLVHFDQPKSVSNHANPQFNAAQGVWFNSVKSNSFLNATNVGEYSAEIANVSSSLSVNMADSQKEAKYYYCKECIFKSVSKQIVINHLASHAGIKPFQCSVCYFKSNWKHVIVRHMKTLHSGHTNIIEQKINYSQEGFILCRESMLQDNSKTNKQSSLASKPMFNCRKCPYSTTKKYHMNFHKKQHKYREGANYKCDMCPYYVKFEKTLVKHKKLHYSSTQNFKPKACFKVDNYVPQIGNTLSTENSPKKYFRRLTITCSKCPARFSQQDRYNRHLNLHGKNFRFKCNQCDYSVQCAANLVKHKKLHEVNHNLELSDSKSFSCSVCPAVFSEKHRFIRHLKFHNRNLNNQYSSSAQASINIIKRKKMKYIKRKSEYFSWSKSLTCPKCPALFTSKERQIRHLELHGQNNKFTCSHCDFSVMNAVNMQRHEKVHFNRRNSDIQEPTFAEDTDMNKSEENVVLETPLSPNEKKLFICDRCPYYSGSKTAVQNHQRSHWFKQSFECPHCDYSALQRGSLQTHLKLHLESSKLYPPEAFMKFQSFKIVVQEENGEKLVFDDEAMVN